MRKRSQEPTSPMKCWVKKWLENAVSYSLKKLKMVLNMCDAFDIMN